MASKEKISPRMKDMLRIKQDLFKKLALDMHELYKKGRLRMIFLGPAFTMTLSKEDQDVTIEKYKLSRFQLSVFCDSFLRCIHYILANEVKAASEKLPIDAAKNFQQKIDVVSEILAKDTTIKNSYYLYSLSKIPFFSSVDWEAEIKVFHSPHEFLTKPPQVSVGRVKIGLEDPEEMPPKSVAFEFEINLKDAEYLIKSLEDLRKALGNLENAEVTSRKVE